MKERLRSLCTVRIVILETVQCVQGIMLNLDYVQGNVGLQLHTMQHMSEVANDHNIRL